MFPVDQILPEVNQAFAENKIVILRSPPGSGKTTRLAPYLLKHAPWLEGRKIVMLEPRRIAARMAAGYMARQYGEQVGETVGYRVRLENHTGPRTKIEILTEGLLTQRLINDSELSDTGLILFDEFHERSLAADTGMAMALEIRAALREDLRIGILSATVDTEYLKSKIPDAEVITAEGRLHPVETRYIPSYAVNNFCKTQQVAETVRRVLDNEPGSILVFLPGEGEIRRTAELLNDASLPDDVSVHPLYGSLSRAEQDAAVRHDPSGGRKVVLATSIAESSVTIEGIHTVIDSGWMRVPKYSPGTGMSSLETLRITADRADQRSGRAGRLGPGVCVRLWDETVQRSLRPNSTPEILDADLAQTALQCAKWGTLDRLGMPWITPPEEAAWGRAIQLLEWLGAVKNGRITARGEKMSHLPVHPRLSGMIITAEEQGLGGEAAFVAAAISEAPSEPELRKIKDAATILEKARGGGNFAKKVKLLAGKWAHGKTADNGNGGNEGALLALAFPDRIAKQRTQQGRYLMSNGAGAQIDVVEPLAGSKYLVCAGLKDNGGGDADITLAVSIAEDDIRDLFHGEIVNCEEVAWDKSKDCLKSSCVEKLGAVVLGEKPLPKNTANTEKAIQVLMQAVLGKGIDALPWDKASTSLRQRVNFLHRKLGGDWPDWSDRGLGETIDGWLAPFCTGITRWETLLREVNLSDALRARLSELGLQERELDRLAPGSFQVPSGSNITIRYDGESPYLSVRIQEVFGMTATPRIAGGAAPVTMHLLSPAQRPVQVTSDLESFWNCGYALVRKDLRGRYPKHYWPEDPREAIATRRVRPRPDQSAKP